MNQYNNFAVASYSFHGLLAKGMMDLFGYLETVRSRYELQTADIWNGFLASYEDEYTDKIKQQLDERGLTVVNLCCDGCHIWDDDPDVRAKNEKLAWDCLKLAEKVNAKTVRIDAGVREDDFSPEQMDYVSKKYREYCKKAASFGAKLGTENHWGATRKTQNINDLFAAVSEPNFGLLLHLGNWIVGDKDEGDRAMIGKAMHMHCDFDHSARADEILPPLAAKGYAGCWTVESHKGFNEYNNVAFQLAQLRRVMGEVRY